MRLTVPATRLREAVSKIQSVVDRKVGRPILSSCLFEVTGETITLVASDAEVSVKYILEANVHEPGSFCISNKNIYDILRELPDQDISLEIKPGENVLKLDCAQVHYSLMVFDAASYPEIRFDSHGEFFFVSSQDMLDIISKSSHAVSSDETRDFLNGVFFQQLDSTLRAVAIDGHRLALFDVEGIQGEINTLIDGVIVPRKGISELKKLADTFSQEQIRVSVDDNFLYVSACESYYLNIRLISRDYPKYQTVIPSKTTKALRIDRDQVLNAVKRIRILSNEKTHGVKFNIDNSSLRISANHPSLGNADETVEIDYEGDPIEIGFNAKYLIEGLSVLPEGESILEYNNELSPVIVRSDKLSSYLGIIMPLKL